MLRPDKQGNIYSVSMDEYTYVNSRR